MWSARSISGISSYPLAIGLRLRTHRGAVNSKGKTSWTGKPEREDYISVAGFLIYYLHHLDCLNLRSTSDTLNPADESILLVLGGYSYGSLITSHLPETSQILSIFSTAEEGTGAAEIKTRAHSLAGQRNEKIRVLGTAKAQQRNTGRGHANTLAVGGEETLPEKRRQSTETKRSIDIKRSLDLPRTLTHFRRNHHETRRPATPPAITIEDSQLPRIAPAYLLISPLLPPISSITALPFGLGALKYDSDEQSERLSKHPSLAVFGNDDFFTVARKLRKWTQAISARPDSSFRYVEIEGAGHFWHSQDAQRRLKIAVREWITTISGRGSSHPTGG